MLRLYPNQKILRQSILIEENYPKILSSPKTKTYFSTKEVKQDLKLNLIHYHRSKSKQFHKFMSTFLVIRSLLVISFA